MEAVRCTAVVVVVVEVVDEWVETSWIVVHCLGITTIEAVRNVY